MVADQYQDRHRYDSDDYPKYDQVPYGHSAVASVSAFLFWRKGSLEISMYAMAAAAMIDMITPDTSTEVPPIRLPMTYTMAATA